jgi:hypothetical protein
MDRPEHEETTMQDREQAIRERAHEIWEREGRPHGCDQKHWEQAVQEIDAESGSAAAGTGSAGHATPPGGAERPKPRGGAASAA